MVKIKEFTEEEAGSEDETTDDEDDDDDEEVPPVPPEGLLGPLVFLAPEPSAPAGAPGPSVESHTSDAIAPIFRVGLSRQYIWYLLRHYGHSIEFNRSFQEAHGSTIAEGLSKWATELQQLSGPGGHGNGEPQFACSLSPPDTPGRDMEDNRSTERTASVLVAETALQSIEESSDREEGNKTESDESAKEKSNGVGEKVQLATTAAGTKAGLLSSPELSDCELSDVSDGLAPPDYESLQAELTEDYTPDALKGCPWVKPVRQTFGMDEVDSEPAESANKEPSEASDDGEAAALTASSVVKDCWEEWVDDDRLFTTAAEAPAPSTSTHAVVTARVPSPESPASPTSERRRVKPKNRQRVRQQAMKPLTRYIFVPTEKIGRIVGKGGRRVREIEKESGAKIKVEHKKSSKPVTQITLTGTEEEISKADEEICVIIRNFKPPKSGEPTTASVSSVEEMELKRLLLGIKNQVLDGEERCRKPTD